MAKTYEIAFKLAGQLSGKFSSTFKQASKTVGMLGTELNSINKQAADTGKLIKLRKEVGESARTYLQAKDKLAAMKNEIAAIHQPTKAMIAAVQKQKQAVDKAKTALDRKRASLVELDAKMGTAGTNLKTLIQREKELAAAADKARIAQERQQKAVSAVKSNNATLGATAGYASAAGAGIGAGIMSAVKVGAQFESQMAKVAAVSRASDAELAQLTEQAKELGKSTVWSSSQAAEGMQYLAMAGFKTEDTLKAMPGMLNLASAGAIDLGRAADISSNILTGFGLSAGEMGRVGDVLTNTFTSSNTTLEMLGNTMKYAAPIAKSMGVSIEEAAAMAGKLGDAGIQGEMAGTTLRSVMLKLSAPTKAASDALKDLGVKTTDAKGNMRSFPSILADIQKATKGMSEAQKAAYVKAIFETEAMSGAMVLMEQAGTGALQKYTKSLEETGSATRVANKQNDNLAGDFKALTSAIEGTSLQIYDSMKPALRELTKGATEIVSKISKWAEANQGTVKTLTYVASGIGAVTAAAFPMLIAIKTAQFVWAAFKAPILAVNAAVKAVRVGWLLYKGAVVAGTTVTKGAIVAQKAFQLAAIAGTAVMKGLRAAQLALNLAMRANPIGLVVTAITGLIAVGVLLYKNWDVVKAKVIELWGAFSEKFPGIASVVSSVYENSIKPIVEGMKEIFGGLVDFIAGVFTADWGKAWEGVKGVFSGVWDTLEALAKAPLNAIISMLNGVIDGVNSIGSVTLPEWAGGKSIGLSIPKIPTLASGGIATQPTLAMIGEGKENEAVLPLSKLDSLLSGEPRKRGDMSITFSPVINISGGEKDAYAQVKRGLEEGQRSLKRELEKLMRNQQRLSYA